MQTNPDTKAWAAEFERVTNPFNVEVQSWTPEARVEWARSMLGIMGELSIMDDFRREWLEGMVGIKRQPMPVKKIKVPVTKIKRITSAAAGWRAVYHQDGRYWEEDIAVWAVVVQDGWGLVEPMVDGGGGVLCNPSDAENFVGLRGPSQPVLTGQRIEDDTGPPPAAVKERPASGKLTGRSNEAKTEQGEMIAGSRAGSNGNDKHER